VDRQHQSIALRLIRPGWHTDEDPSRSESDFMTHTLPTFLLLADASSRAWLAPEGESLLQSAGIVRHLEWRGDESEAEHDRYDEALAEADALISTPWRSPFPRFTPERWEKAQRLKGIAGTYDFRFAHWIDIGEAQRRGVTVIDTSRTMTPTVAEFALAMTLNLLRDIPAAVDLVRQGSWKKATWDQTGFVYGDLTGRRVGLAGFGSINRRYAELLAPFRCAAMAYDPFVSDADLSRVKVERAQTLVDLAARNEIFVVGIPPTPATQQIISREVIEALPTGSLFVLVTRMAVVDQEALWRRCERGEIRASVDVFSPEPPAADAAFRGWPNVLPTPHIAGDTSYCHRRCFTTACEEAVAVVRGGPVRYAVTVRDEESYQGTLEQGER
jgi:phosphoglycerate dehydrogenase-like enzyme